MEYQIEQQAESVRVFPVGGADSSSLSFERPGGQSLVIEMGDSIRAYRMVIQAEDAMGLVEGLQRLMAGGPPPKPKPPEDDLFELSPKKPLAKKTTASPRARS